MFLDLCFWCNVLKARMGQGNKKMDGKFCFLLGTLLEIAVFYFYFRSWCGASFALRCTFRFSLLGSYRKIWNKIVRGWSSHPDSRAVEPHHSLKSQSRSLYDKMRLVGLDCEDEAVVQSLIPDFLFIVQQMLLFNIWLFRSASSLVMVESWDSLRIFLESSVGAGWLCIQPGPALDS